MKFWKRLLFLVALVYLAALAIVALSWVHHLKLSAEWNTVWSFELDPKARVKPEVPECCPEEKD